jgi:hypothetical protein
MTALARSILESEVLRSLQDAENHWLRANKRLVDGDQPPLPRAFYTADEMSLVLQRHEQELAALRPAPSESAWEQWKASGQESSPKPGESDFMSFANALTKARGDGASSVVSHASALDMIEVALKDDRLSLPMVREALAPVVRLCRRPMPSAAARQHISSWLDATVAAWGATPAPDELAIDGDEDVELELELADAVPPEASPAPARIVAAIEDGTVIPIGRAARGGDKERPL